MSDKPALLGNTPLFLKKLPIIQPTLPDYETIAPQVKEIFATGMLTKGKYLRQFEERLAEYLGVKHAGFLLGQVWHYACWMTEDGGGKAEKGKWT